MTLDRDQRISEVVEREQSRLLNFIRRRVPDARDAELEGRSFEEMAAATGVSVSTLLSRKRYAVRHLRERLRRVHDESTKA